MAEALKISYKTIKNTWCPRARKLSEFVKKGIELNSLSEDVASYLLKYDHKTQELLAKCIIQNELVGESARKFFRLYSVDPNANLDELVDEAKGIRKIRIPLEELSEEARKEVERVLGQRKENAERNPRKRKPKKYKFMPKRW